MRPSSSTTYKLGLNTLHFSGAARLLRGVFRGVGTLLTLHHVCPKTDADDGFSPNGILDISPEFLTIAIERIRKAGCDLISLDEFTRRMRERDFGRPFVSFTLDDAYRDNYEHAYPVFAEHEVPFSIYVCTGLMDGTANLWWRDLAETIKQLETFTIVEPGHPAKTLTTKTTKQKYDAFSKIYWGLRGMPLRHQLETMAAMLERNPCDIDISHEAPLTWEMIKEMHASGLLTVGAHTVNHYALSKLSMSDLENEMAESRRVIKERAGVVPEHFAYPFGDAGSAALREFKAAEKLGFTTAVTTRKGVIFREHAQHMHALPRVSLNGEYQEARYVDVFLSGLPFALHNRFRKCDVL